MRDKHGVDIEHKVAEKNQRLVSDMLQTVGKDNLAVVGSVKDSRFILARHMCLWFCRDLLPFNTANKDGLHDFAVYAGLIKSNEKLPDRTTISDTALNDIYSNLKAYIKKFVKSSLPKTVTNSMDFWTDNVKRESYINYWVHWISDVFEMQKLCLGIKKFPHPHTGEDIAKAYTELMRDFELQDKRFLSVTDSGGNLKKGCRLLKLEREACLCHNLHLLVAHDLIEKYAAMQQVRDLIRRMKEVKKAILFRYEEMKKINDDEYNKRLIHLVSTLQNISKQINYVNRQSLKFEQFFIFVSADILESEEVLITNFSEEDEDNELLADFCNNQTRRCTNFTTIKNSNATRWNSVLTMFNSFIKNIGECLLYLFCHAQEKSTSLGVLGVFYFKNFPPEKFSPEKFFSIKNIFVGQKVFL